MTAYVVHWVMEVEAHDHLEATELALQILRDPESTATVFHVDGHEVDLADPPDGDELADMDHRAEYDPVLRDEDPQTCLQCDRPVKSTPEGLRHWTGGSS